MRKARAEQQALMTTADEAPQTTTADDCQPRGDVVGGERSWADLAASRGLTAPSRLPMFQANPSRGRAACEYEEDRRTDFYTVKAPMPGTEAWTMGGPAGSRTNRVAVSPAGRLIEVGQTESDGVP